MRNKSMLEPVAERAVLRLPKIASATATELQNNFGKYMDVVEAGQMVTVTKNGKKIMRLVPVRDAVLRSEKNKDRKYTPILQAIRNLGIAMPNTSEKEETRKEYLQQKYSNFNDIARNA